MSNAGHTYIGSCNGFRAHRIYTNGHGKHASSCSVIAPGEPPHPQVDDINDFHCKHAHAHEDLLRRTVEQLGVELRGKLRPCRGCSAGKRLRRPIPRSTHTRAVKPASRVFVDFTGPKPVRSWVGKSYIMMVRDDGSRHTRLLFLHSKDEAEQYFRIHPQKNKKVRSDGGGEFSEGAFKELCDGEKIEQEKTTADSPQHVAERAIGIIETAGLAAKNSGIGDNLWAEQANWACHALNCTATSANPGNKTPHEMWHG
ncbi:unnamed protein product, partial [Sphacelaria rigidula]